MASPVYGKQFIRFAETGYVPDAVSLPQFRVVKIDNAPAGEPPTLALADGGEAFGVLQQDVIALDPDKATSGQRLGTVATSGLLLVEANAVSTPTQNEPLEVDGNGIAVASGGSGTPVTVGGSTPIVRQQVIIGGVYMVLVSFN
jgi:hypothetical protein